MVELGEGEGSLEVFTQAMEQLATISCAIDRTTQAMFILPHSSQTGEPAESERKACVELTFSRSVLPQYPIVISGIQVEEIANDAGDKGPIPRNTGRFFDLTSFVAFNPGDTTDKLVNARSNKPGYGYNYVMPGNLSNIVQAGSGFNNTLASLTKDSGWILKCANFPDVIIPEHVGQYVEISSPLNGLKYYRIKGYIPPDLTASPPSGGNAVLDVHMVLDVIQNFPGDIIPGEMVIQPANNAVGYILAITTTDSGLSRILISVNTGKFELGTAPNYIIYCQSSGMSFSTDTGIDPNIAIVYDNTPIAEPSSSVSWRIVPWSQFGITVNNADKPTGGRLGMLDELGAERAVYRSPGEDDTSYRTRVANLADTVSPNAIRRVANRIVSPFGMATCLREAGLQKYPGFYYDAANPYSFFYDNDCAMVQGTVTGSFIVGEPVIVNDTPDLLPIGTVGLAKGVYAGNSGTNLFFAKKGLNPWSSGDFPGKYVVGVYSGAYQSIAAVPITGYRAIDKFKVYFDYLEFRAFFLLGLPKSDLGDFGFFYDFGLIPAYDSSPFYSFFDGSPINTQILQKAVWNAVYNAKAGGVGFDIVEENTGCL